MVPSRFRKSTTLLIAQVAWTNGPHLHEFAMKCDKRASVAQHLHNLSPFSLHSMIEVSAEAWHATLYLITPWQHLPRLGMLFYLITPWQ